MPVVFPLAKINAIKNDLSGLTPSCNRSGRNFEALKWRGARQEKMPGLGTKQHRLLQYRPTTNAGIFAPTHVSFRLQSMDPYFFFSLFTSCICRHEMPSLTLSSTDRGYSKVGSGILLAPTLVNMSPKEPTLHPVCNNLHIFVMCHMLVILWT